MYIPTIISSFLVSQKRFGFHRLLRLLHRCAGPRGMADGARLTAADAKREDPGGTFRENKRVESSDQPERTVELVGALDMFGLPMKNSSFHSGKKVVKNSGSWCFFEISGWCWLEPWNLDWLSHQYGNGMSSSQLTFSPSFFRGVGQHQPDEEFRISWGYRMIFLDDFGW